MHENEVQTVSVPIEVAQEYVSKLLGFAPLQLSDDLYNVIITHLEQMIDEFSEKLLDKFGLKFTSEKLQSLTYYLKERLEDRLVDMFDSFDIFLVGKVLYLSSSVVLKDDELQLVYSEKRDKAIENRIITYTNRITVLKTCLTKIEQETAKINSIVDNIKNMKKHINQALENVYGVRSVDELCLSIYERNNSINRLYTALTNTNVSNPNFLSICSPLKKRRKHNSK
ncbi:hypothetical protein MS3_00003636 [Schistosoma haematobium]|uniref:Protein MIS12 homolog n=2 Tax=Schistosoma haematobium TaxID=6185 RepID=A0A922LUD0_SCHHA|nr:hypothetical protein MS3_00003636 [Schistosoma haematobium]KAH9594070.1 hypothetical protein MS3_00003636 [Schistosoma haematobium]CAH8437686.1 unnamed protein product [Schistosoma haematobium]